MVTAKSHITRSIRTGVSGAAAALTVALAVGVAAFLLAIPPATGAEAAAAPSVLAAASPDRIHATPDFVAPTATATPTASPEPEDTAHIQSALTAAATPAKAPAPAAAPRPAVERASAFTAEAATHGAIVEAIYATWPAHLAPTAVVIAQCESSMNPAAVNPSSGATGLFQSLGHGSVPADIYGQAAHALAIYQEAGSWRPWYSSAHCWG